jgi:transcriptional regulator with XRE-family HTH domain
VDIKTKIAKRVRSIRKSKGLSQESLAEKINMNIQSMGRMERGVYYPSVANLEKISIALNVEIKEFFDFDNLPPEAS